MRQILFIIILLLSVTPVPGFGQESGDDHLYAVLVNGGRNRLTNHERYWNDCAFLYRTLRQTYHIPKRNITLLMSDGGEPDRDMLRHDGLGFRTSPVDLDGDGQSDVDGAATLDNVSNVFVRLRQQLTADDRLFLFVMDHGGTDDNDTESCVWLWGEERLNDYVLGGLVGTLNVGAVCILMGQCYSGGFIDNLQRTGLVIATACSGNELSWSCADLPYDEFVYHWVCAVNGADEQGRSVMADADGDGLVSMAEAFDYARSHDRRPETPQYRSWPDDLGARWAFQGMIDLGVDDAARLNNKEQRIKNKGGEVYNLNGQRVANSQFTILNFQLRKGLYILGGKTKKIVR